MAFWSGERLAQELSNGLVDDFDKARIDCATYLLRVGDQAFVTTSQDLSAPTAPMVAHLGEPPGDTIKIAPGQFAFLLTLEEVRVPDYAMALISMRARYKFKGLINVSGFNVDPGWRGKLIFSVYNAGPSEVVLTRGEPLFLIVYADLDRPTKGIYRGASRGQASIDARLISTMSTQVFSPQVLKQQLLAMEKRLEGLDIKANIVTGVAGGLGALVVIVLTFVTVLPSWTGVIIARTLDTANYEIRQKADPPPTRPEPRASDALAAQAPQPSQSRAAASQPASAAAQPVERARQ